MFCANCGAKLLAEDKFCSSCGSVANVVAGAKHDGAKQPRAVPTDKTTVLPYLANAYGDNFEAQAMDALADESEPAHPQQAANLAYQQVAQVPPLAQAQQVTPPAYAQPYPQYTAQGQMQSAQPMQPMQMSQQPMQYYQGYPPQGYQQYLGASGYPQDYDVYAQSQEPPKGSVGPIIVIVISIIIILLASAALFLYFAQLPIEWLKDTPFSSL